jgi:hypothetical protein
MTDIPMLQDIWQCGHAKLSWFYGFSTNTMYHPNIVIVFIQTSPALVDDPSPTFNIPNWDKLYKRGQADIIFLGFFFTALCKNSKNMPLAFQTAVAI